ncbi:MAG: hypothetical protein WA705_30495 [Candidatus Ozemobacteraceae bacterium]
MSDFCNAPLMELKPSWILSDLDLQKTLADQKSKLAANLANIVKAMAKSPNCRKQFLAVHGIFLDFASKYNRLCGPGANSVPLLCLYIKLNECYRDFLSDKDSSKFSDNSLYSISQNHTPQKYNDVGGYQPADYGMKGNAK